MNFLIGLAILASSSSFASFLNGKWEIDTIMCTNGKPMERETLSTHKKELKNIIYAISIKGNIIKRKIGNDCGTTIEKYLSQKRP